MTVHLTGPCDSSSDLNCLLQSLAHTATRTSFLSGLITMSAPSLNRDAIMQAIMDSCDKDDALAVTEGLGMTTSFGPTGIIQRLLPRCLRRAAMKGSPKVISYLVEQGADVTAIPGGLLSVDGTSPTRETLEVLVAHGWDINSCLGGRDVPVLWDVTEDIRLVEWCLDHGASVDPPDNTRPGFIGRMPVLERAAARADIATFELLRAKGAPLCYDYGVFPSAVMSANGHAPKTSDRPSTEFQRRMDMVCHLVDVVGCDVNSRSNGPYRSGSACSTPLCWIACHSVGDAKDLIWLFLDRGGDLDLARPNEGNWSAQSAREAASRLHDSRFLEAVEEWQAKHEGNVAQRAGEQ